jgi:hypothetical protein
MKKTILIAIFTLILFSFEKNQKLPKKENYETLKEYIDKKQLPIQLEQSLFLKDLNAFTDFAFFRVYNAKKGNINKLLKPDVYLFNNKQILIEDDALGGCYIDRTMFVGRDYYSEILKENKVVTKGTENKVCSLEMLKHNLIDYKGNTVFPFHENNPCILIVWAKNKADVNTTKFLITYNQNLIKNSKTTVDIYYLNVDNYSFQ